MVIEKEMIIQIKLRYSLRQNKEILVYASQGTLRIETLKLFKTSKEIKVYMSFSIKRYRCVSLRR